jgi:tryptophan-rich sensory protein
MDNRGFIGIFKLLISIIVCQAAGIIGSFFTARALPGWFAGLNQPSFTPPDWMYAPIWIVMYLLMAIAAFLIWWRGLHIKPVRVAMILFLVQLVLNLLWVVTLFGLQSVLYGLVTVVALWIMVLFTIIQFYKISIAAGTLMIPYILWVTFTVILNGSLYLLN